MSIIERIKNGMVSELELLDYVTDNDINVAVAVAESRFATAPILDIAAHDKDPRVRRAAACNPNIGEKTLLYLAKDNDGDIACIVKKRLERN